MAAAGGGPFRLILDATFSDCARTNLINCAKRPDLVLARRMKLRGLLSQLSNVLAGRRKCWIDALPDGPPAKALNFPIMALVANALGYPAKELMGDLSMGMPIAGVVPAAPTLTSRGKDSIWSVEEWKKSIPKLNAINIAMVVKTTGTKLATECYERTMKEVADGWVADPVPVSAVDANRPLTPRYAAPEQHGNGHKKIRLIDDFRASGVNDTVSVADKRIPDGLDGFLATCSAYQRLLEGRELLACSVDFAHAYKRAPLLTVNVIT